MTMGGTSIRRNDLQWLHLIENNFDTQIKKHLNLGDVANRASFLTKWMLGDLATFLAFGHQYRARTVRTLTFMAMVGIDICPTMSLPFSFFIHLRSFPSSLYRRRFRTRTSASSMPASECGSSLHSSASKFSASEAARRGKAGMVGTQMKPVQPHNNLQNVDFKWMGLVSSHLCKPVGCNF